MTRGWFKPLSGRSRAGDRAVVGSSAAKPSLGRDGPHGQDADLPIRSITWEKKGFVLLGKKGLVLMATPKQGSGRT